MKFEKSVRSLLGFLPFALADIKITAPIAAQQVSLGQLTVTWADNGALPSISDLTTYTLDLFSGSNRRPFHLMGFPLGEVKTGTIIITIPDIIDAASTPLNAFFLQMTATKATGGNTINYSKRFTITGLHGTFPVDVANDLETVSDTEPPAAVANPAAPAAGGGAALGGDPYAIPYDQQTGLTRYAPMQPLPPNSITATNTSPLWPTSSAAVATTFLPVPTIVTTQTQAATWAFTSHPNTAAAQSQPTGDMAKFLNRWKD